MNMDIISRGNDLIANGIFKAHEIVRGHSPLAEMEGPMNPKYFRSEDTIRDVRGVFRISTGIDGTQFGVAPWYQTVIYKLDANGGWDGCYLWKATIMKTEDWKVIRLLHTEAVERVRCGELPTERYHLWRYENGILILKCCHVSAKEFAAVAEGRNVRVKRSFVGIYEDGRRCFIRHAGTYQNGKILWDSLHPTLPLLDWKPAGNDFMAEISNIMFVVCN